MTKNDVVYPLQLFKVLLAWSFRETFTLLRSRTRSPVRLLTFHSRPANQSITLRVAPGGCTIAGLLALEDGRVRSTIARGIQVASERATALGQVVKK